SPPNAAIITPASGFYDAASRVGITESPNSGFTFIGWAGTGNGSFTGTNNIAQVTMNGPITETASYSGRGSTTSARMNAGGGVFTDASNNLWSAGNFGNTYAVSDRINGTSTPFLYQSEAWNSGALTKSFSITNGTYNVRLKFAEIFF